MNEREEEGGRGKLTAGEQNRKNTQNRDQKRREDKQKNINIILRW